jgi:hypothetical protein
MRPGIAVHMGKETAMFFAKWLRTGKSHKRHGVGHRGIGAECEYYFDIFLYESHEQNLLYNLKKK